MRGVAPGLATGALLLVPLAFIEPRTYATLTVGGLAMGMLIFLVASGLTLIFGLMDVLNFAHGALFSWGAYVGFSVVLALDGRWGWAASPSLPLNLLLLLLAILAAMLVAVGLGVILERVIVRPVYGKHMFQILITLGATIVLEELIRIVWGPNDQVMPLPGAFQGSWDVADVIVLRFPVVAIVLGALVYVAMLLVLTRTKVGLIVRAGVESGEMIQVMGYNIHR
ncbi:MAG: branched-chain amino acid ABC transporter permease, partial [Candidatus Rokubacteria bacterium]|nr:branched-chain amino acid ABC transporter permease [Candidatus Rokubacteria bacterium]